MSEIIIQLEERLRQAMLTSNVAELDDLISDDLQFIFLDGAVYTKAMDLEAHRSGVTKLLSIDQSEQKVCRVGDTAVVTVKVKLTGLYRDEAFQGTYRYCRTWVQNVGRWQILGGSVSQAGR